MEWENDLGEYLWARTVEVQSATDMAEFVTELRYTLELDPDSWENCGVAGYLNGLYGVLLAGADRAPSSEMPPSAWQYFATILIRAATGDESRHGECRTLLERAATIQSPGDLAELASDLSDAASLPSAWWEHRELDEYLAAVARALRETADSSAMRKVPSEFWQYFATALVRATSYE